jgi:hypothetical protein
MWRSVRERLLTVGLREHTAATGVASKCWAQVQLREGHGFGPSRKIDEPERRVSLLTVAGERFRNE